MRARYMPSNAGLGVEYNGRLPKFRRQWAIDGTTTGTMVRSAATAAASHVNTHDHGSVLDIVHACES